MNISGDEYIFIKREHPTGRGIAGRMFPFYIYIKINTWYNFQYNV